MLALGRRSGGGRGTLMEGCDHLLGGNGGCQAINMWPARRLGGTHQAGSCAFLGDWAKPAICDCSSLATHGGSYLAAPPNLADVS